MNDDSSSRPSLIERITAWLSPEPDNREELLELLHSAYERNLLDADALSMIEGVMQVSEMQVREIMIPRAQMDVVDINDPHEQILPFVIETAHSRFPVVDGERDNILGILLAKDLLRLCTDEEVNLREILRPAVFVPESKRLNVLLREFRSSRNHIAIVVDEYGGVAGLVTIEDVLEQIVGDIEDEYDYDESEDNILQEKGNHYRVKAQTEIGDFNETLGADLPEEEYDTVGGLVVNAFGHLPKRGESIEIGDFRFQVTRADSRRIHTLLVTPIRK
ncbi:MAG: CBS domain-containing protein [Gammaproteobacteria bacterium]|nr:MAG: CBS domain-containing protein [Gammaproteobacteria bacterium]